MPHKIKNAYDAWWFLYYHPKFMIPERIKADGPMKQKDKKYYREYRDKGGNYWLICKRLKQHALESNLDTFYAKVDSSRRVNDDPKKNKTVECWLEFGPIKYQYCQPEFEIKEGAREYPQHYHDINLDCGGPTFDWALMKLARLVLKYYGDYKERV